MVAKSTRAVQFRVFRVFHGALNIPWCYSVFLEHSNASWICLGYYFMICLRYFMLCLIIFDLMLVTFDVISVIFDVLLVIFDVMLVIFDVILAIVDVTLMIVDLMFGDV